MCAIMAAAGFSSLTRKHGTKLGAPWSSSCSMENVALAVGEWICHNSVKLVARINRAVVLFLEWSRWSCRWRQRWQLTGCFRRYSRLYKRLPGSSCPTSPPFVSDEFLIQKLFHHGKVVSLVCKLLSGCKLPLLHHVVSHLRQVYMILNNGPEELNYWFIIRVDDFEYTLFATLSEVKGLACVAEGHLIRACPNWAGWDATDLAGGAAAGAAVAVSATPGEKPIPAPRGRNSGDTGVTAGFSREKGVKEQQQWRGSGDGGRWAERDRWVRTTHSHSYCINRLTNFENPLPSFADGKGVPHKLSTICQTVDALGFFRPLWLLHWLGQESESIW